ncbi:hypothetical protein [Streptomyces griseosporeus]|uniref:hypothetical protein n=1 Tax=Streptomyces griseosporeus TaxID=1910 RepID=UPI00167E4EA6|nr:hypothetical protein [Streptomyces griseosporeus]GHF78832.1 hypothetical protein GCM10018783_56380 [Streptomyces griseosporeus]
MLLFLAIGLMLFSLVIWWAVLGLHALLLGRMPGRRLARLVRHPRLWGAGALLMLMGGNISPSLCVVGVGLVALGHVRARA